MLMAAGHQHLSSQHAVFDGLSAGQLVVAVIVEYSV
jgi:hypothetical protein